MSDSSEGKSSQVPPDANQAATEGKATGVVNPSSPSGNLPTEPAKKQRPAWVRGLFAVGALVLIFVGVPWGISHWHYAETHVSTDDAYVTGNLVSVSPTISGTLQSLTVDEGYTVHRNQLLARIDPSGPEATLRQAMANYAAAETQIPEAERNLKYQQEITDASIKKAQAQLEAQHARTAGAARQVKVAAGTSRNQIKQAEAQELEAQAQAAQFAAQAQSSLASLDNYKQAVNTARASLDNYRQQVKTATEAEVAAQAKVTAAEFDVARATKDEERYRVLYVQDAVSAQVYDNAKNQSRDAAANLQAATAQDQEAKSQILQAQAGVRQAQSEVAQAQKSVTQADASLLAATQAASAAKSQIEVARAAVGLARANSGQVGIQEANYSTTSSLSGGSEADVSTALAGQQEVEVKKRQIATYQAQAAQAKAALDNAKITLGDTYIYAPNDGTVVKKTANIGASLSPGQSILVLTQADYVWVEANFKETQLTNVKPGESADVEVDAMPGKIFKGRVQSINEATGAATSLLPPDNATGNFTKVVQRIPVRIELRAASSGDDSKYASAKDLAGLRQGMSVTATIDTSNSDTVQLDKTGAPNQTFGTDRTSSSSPRVAGSAGATKTASSGSSSEAGSGTTSSAGDNTATGQPNGQSPVGTSTGNGIGFNPAQLGVPGGGDGAAPNNEPSNVKQPNGNSGSNAGGGLQGATRSGIGAQQRSNAPIQTGTTLGSSSGGAEPGQDTGNAGSNVGVGQQSSAATSGRESAPNQPASTTRSGAERDGTSATGNASAGAGGSK